MPPLTLAESIFLASSAFAAYALVGYPFLLLLLARFPAPPVRRGSAQPPVSILLPVHNGERWIRQKLESILQLDYPASRRQVIVISDGSTDRTEEIAAGFASAGVELLSAPRGGKAAALNAAFPHARGSIVFFTDVRQPLAPDSLRHLVECFEDPTVGAACGELIIRDGETHEEANIRLYWRYEKWIRTQLNTVWSLIAVTGCIYAMRRSLLVPIPAGILIDDAYLPVSAILRGYRIYFDGRAKAFDYPTSLDTEFRRKVRTLAGLFQVVYYFPSLLLPLSAASVHFLSYKFSRLVLPYALLACFFSSFWLPGSFRLAALSAQLAVYLGAAVDPWFPERSPCKRLTSPARTFLVFMLASLCAPVVLFRPAERRWPQTQVNPESTGKPPQVRRTP